MPYSNGRFGVYGHVTPGSYHYHVTGGPRYHRRRRRRSRREQARPHQPPSTPANPQSAMPASSPSLSTAAREILASPPVRRAIAGAIAGVLSGGGLAGAARGAALSAGRDLLALPPPQE